MTCRDFIEFLSDYVGDELHADERSVFETHLAACPACVDYLETFRQTIVLERGVFERAEHDPPAPPEELIQAILKARRVAEGAG
jgi:anti-sigma factor RsiW